MQLLTIWLYTSPHFTYQINDLIERHSKFDDNRDRVVLSGEDISVVGGEEGCK